MSEINMSILETFLLTKSEFFPIRMLIANSQWKEIKLDYCIFLESSHRDI